jgi:hypothetical protein
MDNGYEIRNMVNVAIYNFKICSLRFFHTTLFLNQATDFTIYSFYTLIKHTISNNFTFSLPWKYITGLPLQLY